MAVKYAREQGAQVLSICNTQGSTIPRESRRRDLHARRPRGRRRVDEGVRRAGHRAVPARPAPRDPARHAQQRGRSPSRSTDLQDDPRQDRRRCSRSAERIKTLAGWMADTRSVLFLGRHVGYPIALEGALKLKELAYIHAEGFAAGELKHGPIALIEPGQIVFVIVPSPRDPRSLHPKVVSNIQEIRARGARVIAIAEAGRRRGAAVRRRGPARSRSPRPLFESLLAVVPLHIFGMELAAAKGLDVDQPRNLAKSSRSSNGSSSRAEIRRGHGGSSVSGSTSSTSPGSSASLERTPALRGRLFGDGRDRAARRRAAAAAVARGPVRRQRGADQGARRLDRGALARRRRRGRRPRELPRSCSQRRGCARWPPRGASSRLHLSLSHDGGVASRVSSSPKAWR